MEMKKILLVNKSFETGGIQSSMVNMANELSKYYQVDLLIYNPNGHMRDRLSEKVTVLPVSWRLQTLAMSMKEILHSRSVKKLVFKVFASLWTKLLNNEYPIKLVTKHQKMLCGYDMAISYHQEQRKKTLESGFSRVVYECTDAPVKAAWLHFDSATIELDREFNNRFYEKMDKIVCVSQSLMKNYADQNPSLAEKCDYCYNFIDYDALFEKSEQETEIEFPADKFICFSATRLTSEKAIPRAIKAMSEVFKAHPEVVWYIAGSGPESENIEAAAMEAGIGEQIVLMGNQSNPYSYMKKSDMVINVSYHEAAPMVYFEARALGVPVFSTKTSSTEEILRDKVDSFLCENSAEDICRLFKYVMENQNKVEEAKSNLREYRADNRMSLEKIQSFLNCK